jgi:Cytochrome P460
MPMLKRILPVIVLFAAIACAPQASAQSGLAPPAPGPAPNAPKYTSDGKLLFPDGFRTWIFVGSNIGLAYKEELRKLALRAAKQADKPLFHNIYVTPDAYASSRDNGQFPDPTIFVMDMFASATSEPQHIVTKGSYDGAWLGNLVAVKHSARPPGPNGEKTIWAYYVFSADPSHPTQPVASAAAEADASCEACHKAHGLKDNVWVQFYPTLRDLIKK